MFLLTLTVGVDFTVVVRVELLVDIHPFFGRLQIDTIRHIPLTMQDWEKRLNSFIEMFDYGILQDAGKVSAEIAKLHAETEFEKYRVIQDRLFMSDVDKYMLELEENAKK